MKPLCLWFTGCGGAGKTTTRIKLEKMIATKSFIVLDGTFTLDDMMPDVRAMFDANHTLQIGYVAAEYVKRGVGVIACASSYSRDERARVRSFFDKGKFHEIYFNTPRLVCEERDPRGIYKAISDGIRADQPAYETGNPELVIDTLTATAEENARKVLEYYENTGI